MFQNIKKQITKASTMINKLVPNQQEQPDLSKMLNEIKQQSKVPVKKEDTQENWDDNISIGSDNFQEVEEEEEQNQKPVRVTIERENFAHIEAENTNSVNQLKEQLEDAFLQITEMDKIFQTQREQMQEQQKEVLLKASEKQVELEQREKIVKQLQFELEQKIEIAGDANKLQNIIERNEKQQQMIKTLEQINEKQSQQIKSFTQLKNKLTLNIASLTFLKTSTNNLKKEMNNQFQIEQQYWNNILQDISFKIDCLDDQTKDIFQNCKNTNELKDQKIKEQQKIITSFDKEKIKFSKELREKSKIIEKLEKEKISSEEQFQQEIRNFKKQVLKEEEQRKELENQLNELKQGYLIQKQAYAEPIDLKPIEKEEEKFEVVNNWDDIFINNDQNNQKLTEEKYNNQGQIIEESHQNKLLSQSSIEVKELKDLTPQKKTPKLKQSTTSGLIINKNLLTNKSQPNQKPAWLSKDKKQDVDLASFLGNAYHK